MAMLRRFNEHNVDLNRNFLRPEDFAQRRSLDPNAFGYVDLKDALNPSQPTARFAWLQVYAKLIRSVLSHGSVHVKRVTVGGNYHFQDTIFYGGEELQPSGHALFQIIRDHLQLDQLKSFGVIDVHTGLGPAGFDTLMMKSGGLSLDVARSIFRDRTPVISGDSSDDAASGYENATGYLCTGLEWFLPAHVNTVCLTQEFGSVPGLFVLNAMIQENAMFHHAPSRRLPYAEQLRDVFYVHRSGKWKSDVVGRGLTVLDELDAHVSTAST
ncbi:hypothetical protein PINS_up008665 [Pythium insidiosum]|nr:hypothetical protein PINS_up008665 [Pythium insidiosum]